MAAGAATRRECQGVQVARLVEARHDVATPAVIAGDFNEEPASFVYAQFTARGWTDTYLAAGNPGVRSGHRRRLHVGSRRRRRSPQLESPASNEVERIDFIFVDAGAGLPDRAPPAIRTATAPRPRLFADRPNPFAPACGPAPAPICWPSDHVGAQLDLDCR